MEARDARLDVDDTLHDPFNGAAPRQRQTWPDRHKNVKPKYTEGRDMPGSFEGETVTRRRFMTASVQRWAAVAAAAFTLPALGFALGPLFSRVPFQWQPIGVPSDFSNTTYVTKVLTIVPGVGEVGKTIAYVRARNPPIDTEHEDQYNQFVALSSRCMHLGCPVRFTPAAGASSARATVASTTSAGCRPVARRCVRSTASTRVCVNGVVEIGPRYSVNSELQRFSPRDPGEPLDGIGQYLYPKRFSTSVLPKN